jgi:DNA polymerase/3'-5' exonuclease PolX
MEYNFIKKISNHIQKYIKGLYIVGSIRRKEALVNDIDFITRKDLPILLEEFSNLYDIVVNALGEKYTSFTLSSDDLEIEVNIWKANDEYEYVQNKILRSLDKGHYIGLRKLANKKGLKLSEQGLYNTANKHYIHFKNKKELLKLLKLN